MNKCKLLERVRHNPRDVRVSDFVALVEAFGYTLNRTAGSHRIYEHPDVPEHLNLQPGEHGTAKPYQVREFLRNLATYGLRMEDES